MSLKEPHMLCEQCRERDVAVNLTTIKGDHITQQHLCERCAGAGGFENEPWPSPDILDAIIADVEARGHAPQIALLLATFDRREREHPDVPPPPAVAAFRARHR